ncbi:MAG: type II toxin-antitoxin system VapC family toxin [Candidatus Methylomirabilia bacterium]
MLVYLDTSALVKRYCEERGSSVVAKLILGEHSLLVSLLAFPEARAAFARKRRFREMSEASYRTVARRFQEDWEASIFSILGVASDVAFLAGRLVDAHALRGLDALHLASALKAEETLGPLLFLSSDDRLNEAASAEGLSVQNPEHV